MWTKKETTASVVIRGLLNAIWPINIRALWIFHIIWVAENGKNITPPTTVSFHYSTWWTGAAVDWNGLTLHTARNESVSRKTRANGCAARRIAGRARSSRPNVTHFSRPCECKPLVICVRTYTYVRACNTCWINFSLEFRDISRQPRDDWHVHMYTCMSVLTWKGGVSCTMHFGDRGRLRRSNMGGSELSVGNLWKYYYFRRISESV